MNKIEKTTSGIRTLSGAELDQHLSESDRPLLVYFSAPWCAPCKQVAPILGDLASQCSYEGIVKIDIDESPDVAMRFNVRNIPTVILVVDGEERARILGGRPKSVYEKLLEAADSAEANGNLDIDDAPQPWELLKDVDQLRAAINRDAELLSRRDEFHKLTLLEMAVRYGMQDAAKFLVEAGAIAGPVETIALGSIDEIAMLIADTPSITTSVPIFGTTALHVAAAWGRADVVSMLLTAGADPNDHEDKPPIVDAVSGGDIHSVRVLLEAGALPNPVLEDPSGAPAKTFPPLHLAAAMGDQDICELLIDFGADLNAVRGQFGPKDTGPGTPLAEALKYGHNDLAKFLRERAG